MFGVEILALPREQTDGFGDRGSERGAGGDERRALGRTVRNWTRLAFCEQLIELRLIHLQQRLDVHGQTTPFLVRGATAGWGASWPTVPIPRQRVNGFSPLPSASRGGEVRQSPAKYRSARRLGRKKYAPPRTVTNCGTPDTRRRRPPGPRHDHAVGDRASRNRRSIAEQRIALPGQTGKFRARHPGILEKLELPGDIRVETEEVQPALRFTRRRRLKRLGRRQAGSVLPASPQNPMEADRRHHVVAIRRSVEPE